MIVYAPLGALEEGMPALDLSLLSYLSPPLPSPPPIRCCLRVSLPGCRTAPRQRGGNSLYCWCLSAGCCCSRCGGGGHGMESGGQEGSKEDRRGAGGEGGFVSIDENGNGLLCALLIYGSAASITVCNQQS